MGRVTLEEFMTLDGVVEDPGGETDFEHSGWQMPFIDESQLGIIVESFRAADALLLGRRTYEGFAAAWPSRTGMAGLADRINSMPKYVATRTLDRLEWNATRIDGDLAEEVARIRRDQDLLVVGSVNVAHQLIWHDLVDVYRLWVHPVALGTGVRFFPDGIRRVDLRLVDSKVTGTGVEVLTFDRNRDRQPATMEG